MPEIGKEFMEFTKYKYLGESDQSQGLPQPPLERDYDIKANQIKLPPPDSLSLGNMPLVEAIVNRRSTRQYEDTSLTLEELSFLLWCTQGVKRTKPGVATLRTVPSAGCRHPFETWLLINNVEGVKKGLYSFIASEHKLVEVTTNDGIAERVVAGCCGQGFVGTSAVTFIWAADVYRTKWRYGERSYRYIHLDAGHVSQNLYLSAESIGCGVCAIAAFDDDEINGVLGLDGEKQFVVYVNTVGKKAIK